MTQQSARLHAKERNGIVCELPRLLKLLNTIVFKGMGNLSARFS